MVTSMTFYLSIFLGMFSCTIAAPLGVSITQPTTVSLPVQTPIMGQGTFATVNINMHGSISFMESIFSASLDDVLNSAIVFAPALIDPAPDMEVSYNFDTNPVSMQTKGQMFSTSLGEMPFLPAFVLNVYYDETQGGVLPGGNKFQIELASDGIRTFVKYTYERMPRTTNDDGTDAMHGIFAVEAGNRCIRDIDPNTFPGPMSQPSGYYYRMDLPMPCQNYAVECNPFNPTNALNAVQQGFFVETKSNFELNFYYMYLCNGGFTTQDGTGAFKAICLYEPDAYGAEWEQTSKNGCN